MKRKALGKGLSALLPDPDPAAGSPRPRPRSPPTAWSPTRCSPASVLDPARLEELAASIRESGMVQPILVRRAGERYQIIAGERRWRAAQQAGPRDRSRHRPRRARTTACSSWPWSRTSSAQELSPLEEALAFQRLQEELQLTQEEVARKVGTRPLHGGQRAAPPAPAPGGARPARRRAPSTAGHGRALLALERRRGPAGPGPGGGAEGPLRARGGAPGGPRCGRPAPGRRSAPRANTRAAEERLRAGAGHPGGDRPPRRRAARSASPSRARRS